MNRLDRPRPVALQALVLGCRSCSGGGIRGLALRWHCRRAGAARRDACSARRRAAPRHSATGVGALAAFVALALATTLPLPPLLLGLLSPATAQLYAETLPGWPERGGWSGWRTLALDPYGVWSSSARLALGFGVFAVVVAYPWRGEPRTRPATQVLARLLWTCRRRRASLAALALLQQVAGNGSCSGSRRADERAAPRGRSSTRITSRPGSRW